MSFKADIYVTLKRTVNDPQGLTIRGGLHALGFEAVSAVRAGKFIEVWLEAADEAEAQRQVEQMSDQLLATGQSRRSISPPAGGRCSASNSPPGGEPPPGVED